MPIFSNPNPESNDSFAVTNPDGSLSMRIDSWGRERCGTGTKPTVAIGAGAGTGATVTSNTGSDCDGNVTIQTGTSPSVGTVFTLTFAHPYVTAPYCQLQPRDAGASALFYATTTTTQMVVKSVNAVTASVALSLDYETCGGQ